MQGQARLPPVDVFTGESPDILWEDWLPMFYRAAQWTEEEILMQLPGYLRKRALQEWDLLSDTLKQSYQAAITEMQQRLDPGSKALAAQDFRHTVQEAKESVTDYIRRLEQIFRRAYGKERLSDETHAMLLFAQLHEGLDDSLVKAPAVSGACTYQELCVAAKNEEQRQKELAKRFRYHRDEGMFCSGVAQRTFSSRLPHSSTISPGSTAIKRRCYICDSTEHLMKDCPARKTESPGSDRNQKSSHMPKSTLAKKPETRSGVSAVSTIPDTLPPSSFDDNILNVLFAEPNVSVVRVEDKGSQSRCAHVQIQGVPADGIIDTAADITVISGELFKLQLLHTYENRI